MKTLKGTRVWIDVLQTVRDHRCQARLPYPENISVTVDRERVIFHYKNQIKQYLPTDPVLQKALEGKLQPEGDYYTHKNPTRSK
jgi:hypothetical protein